jgi:endonuclease/exonuclease/phosphatase (EEP) superfamily protein YafD
MPLISALGIVLAIVAAGPTVARMLEPVTGTPAPQLASFAPWALPVWLLAGLLLLIGGPRPLAIVPAAAIVLPVRWLWPAGGARAAPPAEGAPLTLMTLNVLYGRAGADATMELLRRHRVDVLVVQEMTPEFVDRLRAAGIDDLLGHCDLHARPRSAGTGIWSRWPVRPLGLLPSRSATMPRAAIAVPWSGGPDAGERPAADEQFGVLEVTVTGVHTVAPIPGRVEPWRDDLATLAAAVRAGSGPQIYAGDFNASADHSGFRSILAAGLVDAADRAGGQAGGRAGGRARPGFTWPSDRFGPALVRLDHVLVTPGTIGVRTVRVVSVRGTDHHGAIAELVVSG